jgi:ATP-dependent DNA ligase
LIHLDHRGYAAVRTKFDGFRMRLRSRPADLAQWQPDARMQRFEGVLDLLPKGHVFDGELVVLDDAGRPLFKELLFGRVPAYCGFRVMQSCMKST